MDNAKDLDIDLSIYNLLEYSNNYSMMSGSLWSYHTDEVNHDANKINADNHGTDNCKIVANESFEYKTKIIGSKPIDNNTLDK